LSASGQKFIGKNRAPRVQIEYETELYGATKKVELPFVMAVMADLQGKPQDGETVKPIKDRDFDEVEAGTLDDYMAGTKPRATFRVPNKLTDDGGEMPVDLTFTKMEDFSPARIAEQVKPLKDMMEARNQLNTLLSMIDGRDDAEALIERVLGDPALLEALKDAKSAEAKKSDEEE